MLIYFKRTKKGEQHERIIQTDDIAWAHYYDAPNESDDSKRLVITFKNQTKLQYTNRTAKALWSKLRKLTEKL